MKSYTDIEQSKKLAEILPLESADMHSEAIEIDEDMVFVVVCGLGDKNKYNYGSPIWSLAALIGVLPKGTNINTPSLINARYCCWNNYVAIDNINLVDACYEMIIKLHELNLL